MKRFISLFAVLIMSFSIAASSGCNNTGNTPVPTKMPSELIPADVYGDGYNMNMLVGFDEYGRVITPVKGERENKQVGIFYFLWLGQPLMDGIYDVSEIIEQYGKDEVFKNGRSKVSPNATAHWWSKPLFGYYNSSDKWVIYKHLEMLTNAGVDFLVFDTTNCVLYETVVTRILQAIIELKGEGWNVPGAVFYTHSRSIQTIDNIYRSFYKKGTYDDAWYYYKGKPLIIGYTDPQLDISEAESRGEITYNPKPLKDEILEYFTFKEARWPNDPVKDNTFPYTEWAYPQPENGEMMSVSIATHPMVPFSFSLTHENWCNWGRGYNPATKQNVHEDIFKGTFYDSEWKTVYEKDPDLVFVTGWNEWIAYKQEYGGEYMLCDNVDMEYSRDAEPMEGGYEDAYYIQTIKRIRDYKNESLDGYIASAVSKTVDITGSDSQWDSVNAVYRRVGTNCIERNSPGAAKGLTYEQDAPRNPVTDIKVTYDSDNIYFRISSSENIAFFDDESWMNLFIGTGLPSEKGWESYEFVINRERKDGICSVEKLDGEGNTEKKGTCQYSVEGKNLYFSVSRSLILPDGEWQFYFKIADGVQNRREIMDYYSSGRVLPLGRLSYLYQIGG